MVGLEMDAAEIALDDHQLLWQVTEEGALDSPLKGPRQHENLLVHTIDSRK